MDGAAFRRPKNQRPIRFFPWWQAALCWYLVITWLGWFGGDVINWVNGPRKVTWAELETYAAQYNYVTVVAERCHAGPIFAYSLGKPPFARYAVLEKNGALLLVTVPTDGEHLQCSGVLEPLSRFEQHWLVPALQRRFPGRRLFSYRLNATRSGLPLLAWMTLVPVGLVAVAALWHTGRLLFLWATTTPRKTRTLDHALLDHPSL